MKPQNKSLKELDCEQIESHCVDENKRKERRKSPQRYIHVTHGESGAEIKNDGKTEIEIGGSVCEGHERRAGVWKVGANERHGYW